ncbi:hypothetical protein ACEPUD_23605 [Burkholderia ubonensis]|uniref:hypothetical protein n=1 Tax=Burkholderia ubonensis TaxID=101571 RepID=UPI00075ECB59|nr:hypothetical protein [Burkholderia ubonensis]KVC47549.1 hypothetical protein WI72_03325 [Burkholderia ubonensis]KVD96834.1 hypothetical protein WI90_34465 [Burkholderia ubonensis]
MTTESVTTPLGVYRAGCDAALRMLALGGDWRREWHALLGRGIERDCDAVRKLQDATGAADGKALGEAVERVLRDYADASVAIWEDAGELCMRAQFESGGIWREWLREYRVGGLPGVQTDLLPDLSRLAVINEASMPWREWMEALERGMTEVVAPDDGKLLTAQHTDAAGAAGERTHAR